MNHRARVSWPEERVRICGLAPLRDVLTSELLLRADDRAVSPPPLIIPWRGHQVRIRHDDPRLEPYTPRAAVISSAMVLASDEAGLRLAIEASVGQWYWVDVGAREGSVVVNLRQRSHADGRVTVPVEVTQRSSF